MGGMSQPPRSVKIGDNERGGWSSDRPRKAGEAERPPRKQDVSVRGRVLAPSDRMRYNPGSLLVVRFSSVLDLGYWSYTTVVADAVERFTPVVSDPESIALAWVAVDEVTALPLHPRFAEAWSALAARL